jgi:hypothetical protein
MQLVYVVDGNGSFLSVPAVFDLHLVIGCINTFKTVLEVSVNEQGDR